MHSRTSVSASQPLARHGASAAADLPASHRAPGAPTLPIKGARIYALGISTGAVAVFVRFQPAPATEATGMHTRTYMYELLYNHLCKYGGFK